MGWLDELVEEITIPGDAGPSDPRIYIGQNDPVAQDTGQDAAIVWYFSDESAFLISVDQSGDPAIGEWNFFGAHIPSGSLAEYIDCLFDLSNPGDPYRTILVGSQVEFTELFSLETTWIESVSEIVLLAGDVPGVDGIFLNGYETSLQTDYTRVTGTLEVTAAGGICQCGVYIESAAQTLFTNTTVFADIPGMTFFAEANARYKIEHRAAVGGPPAADVKLDWTMPAGANMQRNCIGAAATVVTAADTTVGIIRRGATAAHVIGTTNANLALDFVGYWEDIILETGGTAGNVQLRGAQNAANLNPCAYQANSYMIVTRIG